MAGAAIEKYLVLRSPGEMLALRLPLRAALAAVILLVLILIVIGISLATGSYDVSFADVIETLRGNTITRAIDNVVWEFRFPRTLAAVLVGAMMALSGGALQNVTRNSLADPSLVGISQGAALVVVSAIVIAPDLDLAWRPWLAFGGALGVAVLVQSLSFTRRGSNSIRFILIGIGVAAFISSITSALLTYGDINRAMAALSWLAGSINAASWADVRILALWSAVLMPLLFGLSRIMSALRMGEDTAIGLGAPVKWARYALVAVSVGFAAAATAIVGPLGFVGLIAPHAARRLARAGAGMHMALTGLCGGLLVLSADLLGRGLFAPIQIPAGLVTAIIGVPVFIYLLQRAAAKSHL